ncbi:ABC transporter ATP-binding protein/permease [Amylibacter sp.]|nr:ABC transporter ATP-binding protein/permease [Amylibacter sp.]
MVLSDSLGISLLVPTLQNFLSGGNISDSEVVQKVSGFLKIDSRDSISIFVVLIILFVTKGSFSFVASAYNAHLRGDLSKIFKIKLYSSLKEVDVAYYLSRDRGYFTNLVNDQVSKSLNAFHFLGMFLSQFFSAILYITLSFYFAGKYALGIVIIGSLIVFLFKWLNAYVRNISRKAAKEAGQFAQIFIQVVDQFIYLKSTSSFGFLDSKVINSASLLKQYERKMGVAYAFSNSIKEPLVITVLLLATYFTRDSTTLSSEALFISFGLLYRSTNALFTMQSSWQKTLEAIGSAELVHQEHLDQLRLAHNETLGSMEPGAIDSLTFSNISFRYSSDINGPLILNKINFNFSKNKIILIKGKSGSGKSTLIKIITGLLSPTDGEVLLNNRPLDCFLLKAFRSKIGLLVQEPPIFDGSIIENIVMLDDLTDNLEFSKKADLAAEQAYIKDEVMQLDGSYHANISYGGGSLSGGQKQRLALAREIYKRPDILILDEPTSALDAVSEKQISHNLAKLKKDMIIIIITHSDNLLDICDEAYEIRHGSLLSI